MSKSEELNLENFYKNADERNELINEGWGFASNSPTGWLIDLIYKPEELADFFNRVRKRYESDFTFIPEMVRGGYGSDSKDFRELKYYLTQLDVFTNAFPSLLEHKSLSESLGNDEVSQNIMECMLFYVLLSMERIEDIAFKRSDSHGKRSR